MRALKKLELLAVIVLIMLVIQIINSISGYSLNRFGVLPRYASGLINIFFSPWIHGSWGHLFNNMVPFAILSLIIIDQSKRYYLLASLIIIVVSGLLLWCFGRTAYHIGASGWVFGLWALLVTNAFKRPRLTDIIIGIIVVIYYGTSMVMGMLPVSPSVSFEGHICGAIGGFVAASLLLKKSFR